MNKPTNILDLQLLLLCVSKLKDSHHLFNGNEGKKHFVYTIYIYICQWESIILPPLIDSLARVFGLGSQTRLNLPPSNQAPFGG